MKNLSTYAEMVMNGEICYKGTKKPVIANDCAIKGLALELAVKDYFNLPLEVSKSRENDIIFVGDDGKRHFMEVKSNSSPIENCVGRSSVMAYVFGVQLDKPLSKQWGYVMPLKQFIEIGYAHGHIKSGTSTGGKVAVAMKTQTVWNNSKNEPHGAKAYKLEDAYIAAGAISFSEMFRG